MFTGFVDLAADRKGTKGLRSSVGDAVVMLEEDVS